MNLKKIYFAAETRQSNLGQFLGNLRSLSLRNSYIFALAAYKCLSRFSYFFYFVIMIFFNAALTVSEVSGTRNRLPFSLLTSGQSLMISNKTRVFSSFFFKTKFNYLQSFLEISQLVRLIVDNLKSASISKFKRKIINKNYYYKQKEREKVSTEFFGREVNCQRNARSISFLIRKKNCWKFLRHWISTARATIRSYRHMNNCWMRQ